MRTASKHGNEVDALMPGKARLQTWGSMGTPAVVHLPSHNPTPSVPEPNLPVFSTKCTP